MRMSWKWHSSKTYSAKTELRRNSARLSAPAGRIRPHPRTPQRTRRKETHHHRQLPASAETAGSHPNGPAEQADRHGTCPRFGNAWRSQTASEDFRRILEHGYSVRKVEEIVKSLSEGESVKSGGRKIAPKRTKLPEEFNMLKQQLSGFFSTKVQLTCSEKGKGKSVSRSITKKNWNVSSAFLIR